MKNLVIILLIIVLPIIAYITLDSHKNKDIISLAEAGAGDKPSVMIFSSAMCSECQKLKQVLTVVEPGYKDKINFIKYDAASSDAGVQSLVKKYSVRLVPTMVFVDKSGNQKYRTEGSMPQSELEKKLKDII